MTKNEVKGAFPEDALSDLIAMLKGDKKFDRWTAISAAIKLADYLTGLFGSSSGVANTKSQKPGRYSKDATIKALEGLKSDGEVKVAAIPAWLVPILLKLAQKWLEGNV
jgi:hypothetical protein